MLELLSSGYKISSEILMKEFDNQVSKRTLQRDIQQLSEILPLEMANINNRSQEWFLPNYYKRMLVPVIQKNELLSFHYLKSYLKGFKGTSIEKDLDKIGEKLETLVPGDVLLFTDTESKELIYDQNKGYFDYSNFDDIIIKLIDAITTKNWIKISYNPIDSDEEKTHTIFPHKIYSYNGSMYLLATVYHYKKPISFLIHFIKDIQDSDKRKRDKPDFSMDEFSISRFGVYSGEPEHVVLNVGKDIKRHFMGHLWHESQKFVENDDGSLVLEMDVPIVPDFVAWVLSWGNELKVIEPDILKEKVVASCKLTVGLYGN